MTSHMHTPYGAPTNRLKGNPHRRYETVSIHGPVGKEHSNQFPPRIAFMPPLGFLANSCTANSCTVTVLSCTVPRTLMFEPVTNTCVFGCVVTVSSTGAKNRFKEMTTATSGVLAKFPQLLPIWNPCELRVLCRHSYFGPRTCGGGVTNVTVIEVSGLSIRVSPSHP
jgi:hypothetical protein